MRRNSKFSSDVRIQLADFSGGLNVAAAPALIENEMQDCNGVLVDETIGVVKKMPGSALINQSAILGNIPTRSIYYRRSSGEGYVVLTAQNPATGKAYVYWAAEGAGIWTYFSQAFGATPHFAVLDDVLFVSSGIDVPLIWNGGTPVALDGVSKDFDGNSTPNMSITGGIMPGRYMCVHQNRLVMANTMNNGSEIIFSRYVDDTATIVKATDARAWPSSNSLLINPADGEEITAVHVYLGELVVFKRSAIYMVTGQLTAPTVVRVATTKGTAHQDSVHIVDGLLVFLADDGVYAFDGRAVKELSGKIRPYFKDIQENIVAHKKLQLSTLSDFQSAEQARWGIAYMGASEGSLKVMPNLCLNSGEDFLGHALIRDGVAVEGDAIVLAPEDKPYSASSSLVGDMVEGAVTRVIDGEYDVPYYVANRFEGWGNKESRDTKGTITIDLGSPLTVNGATVKWRGRARVKCAAANLTSYSYAHVDVALRIGSTTRTLYSQEKRPRDEEIVDTGVRTDTVSGLSETAQHVYLDIDVGAKGELPMLTWANITVEAEVWVYEIAPNVVVNRVASGEYVTDWIDLEAMAAFTTGVFNVTEDVPSGCSVQYQYILANSRDVRPTDSSISLMWTTVNDGDTPTINARYIAYKVKMTRSSGSASNSPRVSKLLQRFVTTQADPAYWVGKKTLPITPYWASIYVNYTASNGGIEIAVSKNGSTWADVNSGDSIAGILEDSKTVYVRVRMYKTNADYEESDVPQVFSIVLTYSTVQGGLRECVMTACSSEGRYYLSIHKPSSTSQSPDRLLVLNRNAAWTKYDSDPESLPGYFHALFSIDGALHGWLKGDLVCSAYPYRLYRLFSGGNNIISQTYFVTRDVVIAGPTEEFVLRNMWIMCDDSISGDTANMRVSATGKSRSGAVASGNVDIVYSKAANMGNPVQVNLAMKCHQFAVRVESLRTAEDFGVVGVYARLLPMRIIGQNEPQEA